MNAAHGGDAPTAEFRAYLQWQIETALRRETRFGGPSTSRAPRLRTAIAIVAALAVGAAGGLVPGYAQENRERTRLLESARNEESLARLRLQLAESEYQDVRRRVDVGVAGRETLLAAEADLQALKSAMARIQLDMQEIRATSSAPRNDLDAPLVGGRDFVRDRLMLDLKAAEEALSVADQEVARARQRFDVGIVSKTALLQAEADAAHARAQMQQLAGALDLRQRALRGEIRPDALAAERQRLELTSRLQEQQRSLELARARLDEARRLFAVGQAAEVDAKRAELQVLEQQLEIQRLQQQLQALGAKKD
jgi:hypothetical protein